jgi:hypothetical protein
MPEEIKDMTQVKVETDNKEGSDLSPEAKKADGSSAPDKPLPFSDHPKWKAARAVEAKVEGILEEHGYDNLDDMLADLNSSRELKQAVGKDDIKELKEAKEWRQKVEAYWAEQKHAKLRENDPEGYATQLEKEKRERDAKESERRAIEENERAVKDYTSEVQGSISKLEIPDSHKEFIAYSLGVNNPFTEVDIQDKIAVRKAVKDGITKYNKLRDSIIEEYRTGKIKVPPITPSGETTVVTEERKPKTIKEATEMYRERLKL